MPFDAGLVRERFPERRILWYPSIDSTMHAAARLAAQGCASGTVVGADEQTAGMGRFGRSWHSEKDAGLYFSIVLKLPIAGSSLPAVTLALGLAVQEAIARETGLAADLRWPNDVLLGGKKVCGVLTQLTDTAVVAGIGINVNHESFPEQIASSAASLRMASGRAHSREKLLIALLGSIDSCCRVLVEQGKEAILRMFARGSSYASGKRVAVDVDGAVVTGVTAGLDASGFLILRADDGRERLILAGGVRPCDNG